MKETKRGYARNIIAVGFIGLMVIVGLRYSRAIPDALFFAEALSKAEVMGQWTEHIDPDCEATVIRLRDGDLLPKWRAITQPIIGTRNSIIYMADSDRNVMMHELGHGTAYCYDPNWALDYYSNPVARENDADARGEVYRNRTLGWDLQMLTFGLRSR